MRVVFRAEADERLGAGHALRCLALADAMAALRPDCEIAFAAGPETLRALPRLARHEVVGPEPRACDLAVIDGYGFGEAVEAAWAAGGARVAAIDDAPSRRHRCEALVDPAPARRVQDYRGLVPASAQLLLGLRHALVAPPFRALRQASLGRRRKAPGVRRLLVSTGLGDAGGGAVAALEAVKPLAFVRRIDVAVGAAAPSRPALMRLAAADPRVKLLFDAEDMAELMTAADLCVGAAGGSAWERCTLGLPSLVLVAADNQAENARALTGAGAAVVLGKAGEVAPAAIAAELERLHGDNFARRALSRAASELVDGRGAERVARALFRLVEERRPSP